MKALAMSLFAGVLALSACTTTSDQNLALGALGGAAVGASVSDRNDRMKGALIGAAVGAAAGTMLGQTNQTGKCRYADGRGGTYIANC